MQNTSYTVMAQRTEARDAPDDFPTPPWATHALFEHVLNCASLQNKTCLEPACGAGHMAHVLEDNFGTVSDVGRLLLRIWSDTRLPHTPV